MSSAKIDEKINEEKKKLSEEKEKNTKLKAERKEVFGKFLGLNLRKMRADNEYKNLEIKLSDSNKEIHLWYDWVQKVNNGNNIDQLLKEQTNKANNASKEASDEYKKLNSLAPERLSELQESEAGLKQEDRVKFIGNLGKVTPI